MFDDLRGAWGARKAKQTPTYVDPYSRTEFFVHYDGGSPVNVADHAGCLARVKQDQAFHMDSNGWSDIGYNGLVCQHGRAIEGRGIDYVGAHCPDHNTTGYGFQFMVGGAQQPTDAAKARMRRLYDDATAHSKRTLAKRGHRDGFATACPGDQIYAWVKAGMPAATKEWDEMATKDEIAAVVAAAIAGVPQSVWLHGYDPKTNTGTSAWTLLAGANAQVATLSAAVKALSDAQGADGAAITKAVVDKINGLQLDVVVK